MGYAFADAAATGCWRLAVGRRMARGNARLGAITGGDSRVGADWVLLQQVGKPASKTPPIAPLMDENHQLPISANSLLQQVQSKVKKSIKPEDNAALPTTQPSPAMPNPKAVSAGGGGRQMAVTRHVGYCATRNKFRQGLFVGSGGIVFGIKNMRAGQSGGDPSSP